MKNNGIYFTDAKEIVKKKKKCSNNGEQDCLQKANVANADAKQLQMFYSMMTYCQVIFGLLLVKEVWIGIE